jgi:phosphoglucosamine mutase
MASEKSKKLFGTDGIRGKAGEYPLDERTVERIGVSLVENLTAELNRSPRLLIGRDTRQSGPQIQAALTRGARTAGAAVESAGVITTPGVAYLTRVTPFDAGVVISASHNPYYDNGIKVFSPTGKKLADEMERRIEEDLFETVYETNRLDDSLQKIHEVDESQESDFARRYLDYLIKDIAKELDLTGYKLVIDCANGAAYALAPQLFKRLGAAVEVLSDTPDGMNINENCGALHMEALQQLVKSDGFDLGVAFDGDADRSLFVDSEGNLVDGDHTLLLLAESLKSQGRLTGNIVVATVMSNIGLEIALRERGIEMIRANVGDRYVLEEMLRRDAKLGGEQSGHIILSDISLAGDGLVTAIELLRVVRQSGKSLAELASEMKTYPQILINVRVKSKPPLEELSEIKLAMEGLEADLQGRGRLLVRYSGTENLARVMIEGEEQNKIEEQANDLAELIRRVLN